MNKSVDNLQKMTHQKPLIPDYFERQEAINPKNSYIVQAPAGSGKTELLTQRFLKLLTCVQQPESIVALTFTKKAAHEMRERIISALETIHQKKKNKQPETDQLAQAVLEHDAQHHWELLKHPHRLRIQTIDSLCAHLVNQMPLLSQGNVQGVTEDAMPYYLEAAERCVFDISAESHYQDALKTLLLHVGNHQERCIELLADMLTWREQWLPYILKHQETPALKTLLEKALIQMKNDAEAAFYTHFENDIEILHSLANFAMHNLGCPESVLDTQEITIIKTIASLLLTKEYEWRKTVNKAQGFPAPSSTKNAEEKALFSDMKTQMENLLSHFRENNNEQQRQILENYLRLPPTTYSDSQWNIIQALITLLPLLSAHLNILFTEHQTTDFTEVAARASHALGHPENPTELALYLDYQIQHLLIDEFQDTSLKQFQFIQKLIQGWQTDDGRTLFIVGDPMQSIYRFREADVSLFLNACESGIAQVTLKKLSLQCNFRSRPALIDWVNRCFQSIFPPKNDVFFNAVTHHPSSNATESIEPDQTTSTHFCLTETAEEQAYQLAQKIKTLPPHETVAILVRSRHQLQHILPALKEANITFQSVDMDSLSIRPCIQDLYSLTQYLLQPANQLARLSVLRAPWCGLTFNDLLHVAQSQYEALSPDGQKRLHHFQTSINQAWQERQKQTLALWIETTWQRLGGDLCTTSHDILDIERFFELLDTYKFEHFDIPADLERRIKKLFSNTPTESHVQIMTIHKSKGLEFDHVFLPHIEKGNTKQDTPLLQHLDYCSQLILATLKSINIQQDPLYQYLHYINKQKDYFEHQRLLYVALTRARQHIHCFAVNTSKEPIAGSFYQWLQNFLPTSSSDFTNPIFTKDQSIKDTKHTLKRLVLNNINISSTPKKQTYKNVITAY